MKLGLFIFLFILWGCDRGSDSEPELTGQYIATQIAIAGKVYDPREKLELDKGSGGAELVITIDTTTNTLRTFVTDKTEVDNDGKPFVCKQEAFYAIEARTKNSFFLTNYRPGQWFGGCGSRFHLAKGKFEYQLSGNTLTLKDVERSTLLFDELTLKRQ